MCLEVGVADLSGCKWRCGQIMVWAVPLGHRPNKEERSVYPRVVRGGLDEKDGAEEGW